MKGVVWGGRIKGFNFDPFTQEAYAVGAIMFMAGFIFLWALNPDD